MNYKFGQKNHWRRTMWNRIVEHLRVKPKDAIVLYLAGEQDLDRPIALDRGFRDENMIAVDYDKKVVKKLRSIGNFAIDGDLNEIIKRWRNEKVNVVFADYCGGLSESVLGVLVELMVLPSFEDCTIALNLLKGRENPKDKNLKDYIIGKHRGQVAFNIQSNAFMGLAEGIKQDTECQSPNRIFLDNWPDPCFLSYMSTSGQRFDSVCWRNLSLIRHQKLNLSFLMKNSFEFWNSDESAWAKWYGECYDLASKIDSIKQKVDLRNPVDRKILALRATRTRTIQSAMN